MINKVQVIDKVGRWKLGDGSWKLGDGSWKLKLT